jgi:hypothetical protein
VSSRIGSFRVSSRIRSDRISSHFGFQIVLGRVESGYFGFHVVLDWVGSNIESSYIRSFLFSGHIKLGWVECRDIQYRVISDFKLYQIQTDRTYFSYRDGLCHLYLQPSALWIPVLTSIAKTEVSMTCSRSSMMKMEALAHHA